MEHSNIVDDITGSFMHSKVKQSCLYAQHLYASLCNNYWQKSEIFPMIKGEVCGVSWRAAGKLIAELREEGSYLDWYCSGTIMPAADKGFVEEGTITEEIESDFKKLGWHHLPENNPTGA